jgi:hypothetical protein
LDLASVPEYDLDVILKEDICNGKVKVSEEFQSER